MSPTISIEPFIEPIHAARLWTETEGTTSTMGFPNRVTRIGVLVLETSSNILRHFALNSEMDTSRMVRTSILSVRPKI